MHYEIRHKYEKTTFQLHRFQLTQRRNVDFFLVDCVINHRYPEVYWHFIAPCSFRVSIYMIFIWTCEETMIQPFGKCYIFAANQWQCMDPMYVPRQETCNKVGKRALKQSYQIMILTAFFFYLADALPIYFTHMRNLRCAQHIFCLLLPEKNGNTSSEFRHRRMQSAFWMCVSGNFVNKNGTLSSCSSSQCMKLKHFSSVNSMESVHFATTLFV